MEQQLLTRTELKESIARKLAEVANESVWQFFDKSGTLTRSSVPLLAFLKELKRPTDDSIKQRLLAYYPWLTEVDLALARYRMERESDLAEVDAAPFFPAVQEDFSMIQSNLEAVCFVWISPQKEEESAIFAQILNHLDPFTLHQLEKYLRWNEPERIGEMGNTIEEAWRELCVRHEINLLRNQNEANQSIHCWKAYFVARYFKRCMKGLSEEEKKVRDLLSLALLFDNRKLLHESKLMRLADLETDTR